jgi:hypothetical protein
MLSPKPHLLTIPREIRDIIYTHLSHDIAFRWGYRTFSFPLGGSYATPVHFHGVPSLSALLTCSRIFEEYSAAPCFRNLSLSLTTGKDSMRVLREDEATNRDRALDLFSHIQRVNFHIDSPNQRISRRVWLWIDDLTTIVSKLVPEMAIVKVATQHSRHMGSQVWKPCSGGVSGVPHTTEEREMEQPAVVLGGESVRDGDPDYWNRSLEPITGRDSSFVCGKFV